MSWTDDRVTLLKKLWSDGLSASQIAGQLGGGISRSSVLGKAHRLGLADRTRMSNGAARRGKPPANAPMWNGRLSKRGIAKPVAKVSDQPPPAPYVEAPTNDTATRTLVTLERGECRWPIGDPKTSAFGFCGCKAVPGQSYCETHRKIAYAPVAVVKRKPVPVEDSVAAEGVRQRAGVS